MLYPLLHHVTPSRKASGTATGTSYLQLAVTWSWSEGVGRVEEVVLHSLLEEGETLDGGGDVGGNKVN